MTEEIDVLTSLQEDVYRFGDIQAILYDRKRIDFFPEGYLGKLYRMCKESRRRSGNGILDTIFGGNPESTYDSIVSYLAGRPVVVLGKWEGEKFREIGFCFLITFCGIQAPERSMFAGYGFFKEFWGTEDMRIAAILGLAYLFKEFQVKAIHGIRYTENVLTKKFTEQFGFRQIGEIPYYHLRDGKLVSGVLSSLMREDFEECVKSFLVQKYREAKPPMIGTEEHPAVEESRATIDAQIERLVAGQIPVVFLPFGSTYLPAIPEGMEIFVAASCPGAGVYFYNPQQVSKAEISKAAEDGTHGQLLGHIHDKMKVIVEGPAVIVQAVDAEGVVLKDSVVPRDAVEVAIQSEVFKRMFPDCEIRLRDPLQVIEERVEAKPEEKPAEEERQLPLAWY